MEKVIPDKNGQDADTPQILEKEFVSTEESLDLRAQEPPAPPTTVSVPGMKVVSA